MTHRGRAATTDPVRPGIDGRRRSARDAAGWVFGSQARIHGDGSKHPSTIGSTSGGAAVTRDAGPEEEAATVSAAAARPGGRPRRDDDSLHRWSRWNRPTG